MVISTYKAGRLGNRLFHFSNFIVNSRAHDYQLIYPFFDEYSQYFSYFDSRKINDNKISLSFSRNNKIDQLVKLIFRYLFNYKLLIGRFNFNLFFVRLTSLYKQDNNHVEYDLNEQKIVNNRHKVILLNGWLFRDKDNQKKYFDFLREVFRPKEEYLSKINDTISTCREKGDVIIGVHIRRGDYREYCDGKYFLDDATYLNRMKAVEDNFLANGRKCVFLLASNEDIDLDNFSSVRVVRSDGGLITDLYSLSKADYLIGPPSTFTMWASFYGAVPLLAIDNQKSDILLSDFKVVDSL